MGLEVSGVAMQMSLARTHQLRPTNLAAWNNSSPFSLILRGGAYPCSKGLHPIMEKASRTSFFRFLSRSYWYQLGMIGLLFVQKRKRNEKEKRKNSKTLSTNKWLERRAGYQERQRLRPTPGLPWRITAAKFGPRRQACSLSNKTMYRHYHYHAAGLAATNAESRSLAGSERLGQSFNSSLIQVLRMTL